MPPETLVDGVISKPADVFSFGVLLWQVRVQVAGRMGSLS